LLPDDGVLLPDVDFVEQPAVTVTTANAVAAKATGVLDAVFRIDFSHAGVIPDAHFRIIGCCL
jgi:hypothetical protein